MAGIEIEQVTKRFGAVAAVRSLSLEVGDREFVTLLGPSGCGKTTLLRLIAGFMAPGRGRDPDGIQRRSRRPAAVVPPERRGMGMVFQNYAVWPHRTVYQNVAFGLEVRRVARAEARARVARMLELVNLARTRATLSRASSAAASSSGWRWPAASSSSRASCCSTSRCRTSTPSCASACAGS